MLHDHAFTTLVTVAALVLYFFMGLRVAGARGKYGVAAPATTGDPIFERHFRVQMNTLEYLPIFLPCLWLTSLEFGQIFASGIGLMWVAGRVVFMFAYVRDPQSRTFGFLIQLVATFVLLVSAGYGAVRHFMM